MYAQLSPVALQAALDRAQELSLRFQDGAQQTRAVPFSFTPCPLAGRDWERMRSAAPLLGRLTQAIADSPDLIQRVHAPLASADPFFAELLRSHEQLQSLGKDLLRVPLLLQRSDFMVDARQGPRLVECNSIAAGMAPFGEQTGNLQQQLRQAEPATYTKFDSALPGRAIANNATQNMARAIQAAAIAIAAELGDSGPLRFLMVIQEREDNIFDQLLLEQALQRLGVETERRTFRELHGELGSGPGQSLTLAGTGTVHVVYLRAGYAWQDYVARDLDSQRCCDALQDTRLFIERHRVAVNATVAHQLATSKRMQLHLAQNPAESLAELGFDASERDILMAVTTPMRSVDADSAATLRAENSAADWVLKNQGEGGGHCLFDDDILHALDRLGPADYGAWTLMQRLRPALRPKAGLVLRDDGAEVVENLISEIGLFTAHLGPDPLPAGTAEAGYLGYLVRSKPADVVAGGVHSGEGALDSLVLLD